ncbi:MAG: cytochrome c family protein [Phycisphaerales bacterium]|nr:cytochrome c family protein [Phycisphaerales bacterium]
MRSIRVMAIVGLVAALVCAMQWSTTPAQAGEGTTISSAAVIAVLASDDKYEFEGSKSCKKCHIKTYKSWEDTPHAKALETLKPGNATEEKEKHNLDAAKDYSTDEKCLACHTVGYGKAGGYAVPDSEDKKAVKDAEERAGVGCESCHGASSGYMDLKAEIKKEKRKYKTSELTALGLVVPTAETCTKCHTEDHPTFDPEDKFDFDKMKEKGLHEMEGLELREDE